ncbi:MAG: Fe-S oxidoreductase, partial [Deltaproteobacteria bacterium]
AEVLATACPYCITAFEDSRAVLGLEGIEVRDITEILAETL